MDIQSDGRIVAVGLAERGDGSVPAFGVCRYRANGTLDPTFGTGGFAELAFSGPDAIVSDIAIQPDGRIVVLGQSRSGHSRLDLDFALVRYNANGTFDQSFGVQGKVHTDFSLTAEHRTRDTGTAVALQPDGRILAAGVVAESIERRFAIARYEPSGALDASFGVGGRVQTSPGGGVFRLAGVAVQDDGRIVVAGQVDTYTPGDIWLARYLPDGSPDPSFGDGGQVLTDAHHNNTVIFDLALQPDGKAILAGRADGVGTYKDFYLRRYNTDGSPDPSFDGDGKVQTDFGRGIVGVDEAHDAWIDGAGRIIVAGQTQQRTDPDTPLTRYVALARYTEDGSLDANFGGGGLVETTIAGSDAAHALAVQRDGKIIAGGMAAAADTSANSSFAVARYDDGPLLYYLRGNDGLTTVNGRSLTLAAPAAQAFTPGEEIVTWLSTPAASASVPNGAVFQFVTPCTKATPRGKTVELASTDVDGADEQILGTGFSRVEPCGRYEVITIPVPTPATWTNRRLKLTVTTPETVHLQLGTRTFLRVMSVGR